MEAAESGAGGDGRAGRSCSRLDPEHITGARNRRCMINRSRLLGVADDELSEDVRRRGSLPDNSRGSLS